MKLSYLPILIASVLLLSAANEPIKPSPKISGVTESPRAQVTNEPSDSKTANNRAAPSVATIYQTEPIKLGGPQEQRYQNAQKEATYTGFLVIVGVFAIFISFLQYRATQKAAEAAKESARSAKQSAEIADKAIRIDRPYLIVESLKLVNFWPASRFPKRPVIATFGLRNYGKGTAIAPYVRARLDITEIGLMPRAIDELRPEPSKQYPTLGNHARCEHQHTREQVIPAGAVSSPFEVVLGGESGWSDRTISFLDDGTFARLTAEWHEKYGPNIQIAVHIVARYRDVVGISYAAESIWDYWPSHDPEVEGHFSLGQWAG